MIFIIFFAGASLLDLLEAARSNLGQLDVRTTNEQNLVTAVNSFYDESMKYDAEFNSNQERSVLKIMDKYKEKLFALLDLPWNISLAVKDGNWIFFRASPLKENTKFECPECSKVYKDARSLQDHLKSIHEITQNVPKPRVTCRLPHTDNLLHTIQWDQITNHLLRVHKIPKPSKLHFFRGFESQDGGANCKVVWRKKEEQDPKPPSQQNAAGQASGAAGAGPSSSNTLESEAVNLIQEPPSQTDRDPHSVDAAVAGPSVSKTLETEAINLNQEPPSQTDQDPLRDAAVTGASTSTNTEGIIQDLETPLQELEALSHFDALQDGPFIPNTTESEDAANDKLLLRTEEDTKIACSKQLFPGDDKPESSEIKPSHEDKESKSSETVKDIEPEKSKCSDPAPGGFNQNFHVSDEVWEGLEADSDVEPDDSAEFTEMRLANKKKRYQAREERSQDEKEPHLLPENEAFIQDFRTFISKKGVSDNPDENTFKKSDGLLFRHDDSWLKFMMKKKPGFMLHDLLKFDQKDEFVEVKDPQEWIDTIGGPTGNQNPSRQREALKSHKQFRDYISRKLSEADIGADYKDLWWQDKIKNKLDQITKDIADRGLWTKLKDLIKVEFTEKQISRDNLCPNKNSNETKANAVYFSSEKYLAREEKMKLIHRKTAEENKDPSQKDYNEYLNFSRHILGFTDRCRQGVYQFTNQDFFNKKECWFPENFTEEEFDGIPDDHVIFQEPEDKRPPDMWLIRLSGSGSQIKMKNGTTVTVNRRALDLMTKCRDLKDAVFGKLGKFKTPLVLLQILIDFVLDPKAPFFCKFDGKPFGQLVNKKGSLMAEFGEITGIDWCTQTSLRRSLEKPIQSNEAMKTRSKTIAQHSAAIGSKYYDRTAEEFRAAAMHHIGTQDGSAGPSGSKRVQEEVSDELAAKRKRMKKEDEQAKITHALENVQKHKKRNMKLGKTCKVLPDSRLFLQTSLSKDGKYGRFLAEYSKFPSKF